MNRGYILNIFEDVEEKEIQEERICGLAIFRSGILTEKWNIGIGAGLRAVQ